MRYLVFSIKDIVAGAFGDLRCFNNMESAIRWFKSFVKQNEFGADLQLFLIGKYNIATGDFIPNFEFVLDGVGGENEK